MGFGLTSYSKHCRGPGTPPRSTALSFGSAQRTTVRQGVIISGLPAR